jgi:hypothetical protein
VNVGDRVGMYVGANVDRDVGGFVSPMLDGVGVVGDAVGAAQTRSRGEAASAWRARVGSSVSTRRVMECGAS